MQHRVISTLTSGRVSGVDVFVLRLTRGLLRRGVDARILLTETDIPVPDPMPLPDDVPVEVFPTRPGEKFRSRRRRLAAYLAGMGPCIYMPNYDYNHSAVSAELPDEVATVGIVHSDDPMHYDHVRRLGRYWNAIVAVSGRIAEKTRAIDRRFADRLATIPYGVEAPPSAPGRTPSVDGALRLIYAGRLEHAQKRVLDLARILDRARKVDLPLRLTVVGAGDARGDLARSARAHLESGALRMISAVPNDRMKEYYAEADCFLLTSAYEGLPVSLLEAMAHGCVPLVTDVSSGIPELIEDGINGFRLPVGDVYGFVDRLTRLRDDPALLAGCATRAHETIRKRGYDVERMASQYAELFENVMRLALERRFRKPRPFPGEDWARRLYGRAGRRLLRWMGPRGKEPSYG